MGSRDEELKRARAEVEQRNKQAEEERRRQILKRRIEVATAGVKAYKAKKMADAVKSFQTYLKILEDWKEVGKGGLTPAVFDRKRDLHELLLISSIYWDLVKLYDRTKSADKKKDFLLYLDKFVLFSKGMPYFPLCAENLRKYISNGSPRNTSDLKRAYRNLTGAKCFIATSLIDVIDPMTLPRLQGFRDRVLLRSRMGRWFVQAYYGVGPALARGLDHSPDVLRRSVAGILDRVAARISQSM